MRYTPFRSRSQFLSVLATCLPGLLLAQSSCSDTIHNHYYETGSAGSPAEAGSTAQSGGATAGGSSPTGSAGEAQAGEAGALSGGGVGGAGGAPDMPSEYPDAPAANTSVAEHSLDLFGALGNRFWFGVSAEQLESMNEGFTGGGPIFDAPLDGDLYSPGGTSATFADHLWVTSAGTDETADYGKIQVKLAGQSSRRPWNKRSIPNLNLDVDEFVDDQRMNGFEHLRLNNGQIGSIFREHLALEVYRRLGYPAPLSTYAWVSSNVWGGDVSVPYILVERYKRAFCEREKDKLGGGCTNMWEYAGDFAKPGDGGPIPIDRALVADPIRGPLPVPSIFDDPQNCQLGKCENERVKELQTLLADLPMGEGFQAATTDYVDWPEFQRFQCLSWILGTGDDAIHNQNNAVLVERADGKFQYLPYSVDISFGQDWFASVPLGGQSVLARGCQGDPSCWAETVATCEGVVADFTQLKPARMLDDLYTELSDAGMLRDGDEQRYEYLQEWIVARLEALPTELEENRDAPVMCGHGLEDCAGVCVPVGECGGCLPPVFRRAGLDLAAGGAPGAGEPAEGAAGAGSGEGGAPGGVDECPVRSVYRVRE